MSSLPVKSPTLPSKSSVYEALHSVDHCLGLSRAVGVGHFTCHHSTMDLDNVETAYPCGFQHCLGPWGSCSIWVTCLGPSRPRQAFIHAGFHDYLQLSRSVWVRATCIGHRHSSLTNHSDLTRAFDGINQRCADGIFQVDNCLLNTRVHHAIISIQSAYLLNECIE